MPTAPLTPIVKTKDEQRRDNRAGIIYMILAMFVFSAVDTQAKYLTMSLPPLQIVWARQLALLIGVLILLVFRGRSLLATPHPFLQIGRGALAACSATLFIVAVSYVSLVDAVAVSFVAPFFVTVLGIFVLGELVGIRRWAAIGLGFIGTLIITRPGLGVIHPAVLLVVVAALFFALRQIMSRFLSRSDKTQTTLAYTAITGSILLTIPLPFIWTAPTSLFQIGLMASMSIMAALAEFLVIRSLEKGEAVVLAPLMYTLIIWGTGYSYFVFGQLPDGWTWLGTAIIIASGLYAFSRERARG